MVRLAIFCLLLVALPLGAKAADSSKKEDKDSKSMHATISKIDSEKHSLSVKTTDDNGKEQDKTLQLSSDAKYLNAAGKEAKADSFKAGDDVCVTQKDGKVTEVRLEAEAKITNVDKKAGTVTVKMIDDSGKQVDRTFRLVEDSEYIDSMGRVVLLDVFQSGDDILFVETDGHIKSMKKGQHKQTQTKSGAKEDTNKSAKK